MVVSATPAGSSVSLSGMGDADSMSNQAAYLEVKGREKEEEGRKEEERRFSLVSHCIHLFHDSFISLIEITVIGHTMAW